MDTDQWGEVAARLAARAAEIREGNKRKPRLRAIASVEAKPARWMSDIDRESHLRWFRVLRRALRYMHVELFFEQALIGKSCLDDLSDDEIIELHRTIEKAKDCYHHGDGVSYYEAGLLRSQAS